MVKYLKKYIPVLLILVALLIVNQVIVFENAPQYTKFYFSKMVFISAIIFSLLANAAYYSNRSKIEKRFLVFTYFCSVMILDLLVVTIFMCNRGCGFLIDILAWLAMGRFVLALGFLDVFSKEFWFKRFSRKRYLLFTTVVLVITQVIVYTLWATFFSKNTTFVFFVDTVTSIILLTALINTITKAPIDILGDSILGAFLFFIAQSLHTLLPYSFENLIQSMTIHAFGTVLFVLFLNHINSSIPQKESRHLRRQFNLYAKNLKKIIDKKTIQLREVNDRFMGELEYAKKIQQSLLPESSSMYRDVVVRSGYFPCEQVSGDFYDVFRIDDDNIALYVLDVAGHGISAALMTMFSNNYLKSTEPNIMRYRGLRPEVNLQQFYTEFNKMNFPDEMHMVIFYATLNLNSKELTYCSGGLNCNPILLRARGGYEMLEESKGFAIFRLDDLFTPEYKSAKVVLEKGDRLLFYTDGLVDKEKNGMFSPEDLIDFLLLYQKIDVETVYDMLTDKIKKIQDQLDDDITFVLMEV